MLAVRRRALATTMTTTQGKQSRIRVLLNAFSALFIPTVSIASLVESDFRSSLENNSQLRDASPQRQEQARADAGANIQRRLRMLRRVLLSSFISMTSAVATAYFSVRVGFGVPVSGSLLAVASVFCFAWSTLGRLGWAGQSWKGTSSVERLDQVIFHALYWLGMYFAAASAL
jgi:hypothetical protein